MRNTGNKRRTVLYILVSATVLSLLLARGTIAARPALTSGEPLPAGGGLGQLASPNAIRTCPIGYAYVYGGKRPDLFVSATSGLERALYLYRWLRDDERGQPVFAAPVRVKHPFGDAALPPGKTTLETVSPWGRQAYLYDAAPNGTIVDDRANGIHGYFLKDKNLIDCAFDKIHCAFTQVASLEITGLPREPREVAVTKKAGNVLDVVVTVSDGKGRPPAGDLLYDAAGVYRGSFSYDGLYRFRVDADLSQLVAQPKLFSATPSEVLDHCAGVAPLTGTDNRLVAYITGSRLGVFYYFPVADENALGKTRTVFGPDMYTLRHPSVGSNTISYPSADGKRMDLIVGGEGPARYYRFSGRLTDDGHPVYEDAQLVLQEDAMLYGGPLTSQSIADWDGDDDLDLVTGNSEGTILFLENKGTNEDPSFAIGAPLFAGGEMIHIQPGYRGVQGPLEARWGYTSATVADWNQDGLPDLLTGDSTSQYRVFLNVGSRTRPSLASGRLLYKDGLELHGTWRVKPGVAKLGDRMAYVILDDENTLHLYWRIDDYNLEDGGQLKLTDGTPLCSTGSEPNNVPGQTGRAKIEIADWDGDGVLDLLVGSDRRGSIPDPHFGLPWARGRAGQIGMQVIYLRNAGSNEKPSFEFPKQFQFRGKDFFMGGHGNTPSACALGDTSAGVNLLVGMESGRFIYFHRSDLNFAPYTP